MGFLFSDGSNVLVLPCARGLQILYSRDYAPIVADLEAAREHARKHSPSTRWIDPVRYVVQGEGFDRRGGYVRDGARVAV